MSGAAAARRCARQQRGVALVEAVMVLPLFVVLLGALGYVPALYLTQLSVRAEARRATWSHALSGCQAPAALGAVRLESSAGAELAAPETRLPASARGHLEVAGGARIGGAVSGAHAQATAQLSGDRVLELEETTLTAQMWLPCDEAPRAGNLPGALRYGWTAVRFW